MLLLCFLIKVAIVCKTNPKEKIYLIAKKTKINNCYYE